MNLVDIRAIEAMSKSIDDDLSIRIDDYIEMSIWTKTLNKVYVDVSNKIFYQIMVQISEDISDG